MIIEHVIGYSLLIIKFAVLIFGIVICTKRLSLDKKFYSKIIWFLILLIFSNVYQLLVPYYVSRIMDSYATQGKSLVSIVKFAYYLNSFDTVIFIIAVVILLISLNRKHSMPTAKHEMHDGTYKQ